MKLLTRLLLASLVLFASGAMRADEEQDLLTVLQSGTDVPRKCTACQRLRVIGTPKSVPALAALLRDERTGHAARYALEGMPFPEAGAALRQALGSATGAAQAGIADSLGWRHDPAAVPLLKPLVTGPDPVVAAAAATALGRIGGTDAARNLLEARGQAPAPARFAVLEGVIRCAEQAIASGNNREATAWVKDLKDPGTPEIIRAAAWRCQVLANTSSRAKAVTQALAGKDPALANAALRLIRELEDPRVAQAGLAAWKKLDEAGQLAVLDANLGPKTDAMGAIRKSLDSPFLMVRMAAWQALGDRGDHRLIPALVKAAATAEPAERTTARETLGRIHGNGIREALLHHLDSAPPAEQAELLRAFGERGDAAAHPTLLKYASATSPAVRLAALESLRSLALSNTLQPLLELAGRAGSDTEREPVMRALFAVCHASPDKDQAARLVVQTMQKAAASGRRHVLPLLPELGTSTALDAALAASRENDLELVKESIRALGQWPSPAPASRLLDLARGSTDTSVKTLALRGYIDVAAQEPQPGARLALLQAAMAASQRPEDQRQVLGQLRQIATAEALRTVFPALEDAALADEAGLAAVTIAEAIKAADPALASDAGGRVLLRCRTPELVKRAWGLRGQPPGSGAFIQDWLVAGPYSQAGANDAMSVFRIPFGPEKAGETVTWKPVPRADMVPLSSLFPDQTGCAAYLKTTIIAPQETEAMLLLASDDGIEVWVNGTVVHANNVDRGAVADQDMAPVVLKAGANELLMKITQGGGGWAACARVVSRDGKPLPELRFEAKP